MRSLIAIMIMCLAITACGKGGDKLVLDKNDWMCAGSHQIADNDGNPVTECNMYIKRSAWRR
jgi:hypothetical protein